MGRRSGCYTRIKRSIDTVKRTLKEFRNIFETYNFKDSPEEIHFFKSVKPKFYSWLIYFLRILSLETGRPTGSVNAVETYLQKNLSRLTTYFKNNLEFYQYYRSGCTHLDELYFLRKETGIYIGVEETYFYSDPQFSTTHDHKVAKILANELIRIYISESIASLDEEKENTAPARNIKSALKWTGSKTALIELLYGLQASGVFNNGNADIKLIASFLESMFLVDLGNYYRVFQEIRIRKKSRTQFLDLLIESLVRRMDKSDEDSVNCK